MPIESVYKKSETKVNDMEERKEIKKEKESCEMEDKERDKELKEIYEELKLGKFLGMYEEEQDDIAIMLEAMEIRTGE